MKYIRKDENPIPEQEEVEELIKTIKQVTSRHKNGQKG